MINIINSLNLLRFLEKDKDNIKQNLIYLLFKEIENLHSIDFEVNSEYNDNNYYNEVRLNYVNKIPVDPYAHSYFKDNNGSVLDADPDDSDVVGFANKDLVLSDEEVELIGSVLEQVASIYDYGNHILEREDFQKPTNNSFDFYEDCLGNGENCDSIDSDWNALKSILIKKNNFKGVDPRLTLFYSTFEKLDKNQEACFKDNVEYAYYYAKYVLKNNLPKDLESFFNLKSFEKDGLTQREKHFLNLYLEFCKK